MKKLVVLLLAASFSLTACWDYMEIENLGIISVMGIGLGNNDDIRVVLHETPHKSDVVGAGGSSSSSSTPSFYVYSGTGSTIAEALKKTPTAMHHKLNFNHMSVIILDEELVSKEGIQSIIDFFQITPGMRLNTWVLISPRGKFDKVLNTDVGIDVETGTIIGETIQNEKKNSFFSVINIGNAIELLNTSGRELYTSGLDLTESDSEYAYEKFNIQSTAVFKDFKMVGWLSPEEHRGFSWVNETVEGGEMKIYVDNKAISLRTSNVKSEVEPELNYNELQINIDMEIKSNIIDNQSNLDFTNEDDIIKIEQLQSEEIKNDITALVNKSKKLQTDSLGFGNSFNMKYPLLWKEIKNDWYSYFNDINFNINVNCKIETTGRAQKVLPK